MGKLLEEIQHNRRKYEWPINTYKDVKCYQLSRICKLYHEISIRLKLKGLTTPSIGEDIGQ